jgi:hypothetical protein
MPRYYSRDKHWLLLAILTILLVTAPLSRAQAQDDDQDQYQAPAPSDVSYDSQARIVRVSYVEGQVRIDTGHGYESATMNLPITERTWLETRSDGWAEVQFEDGSLVRLSPDTVINFTQLGRLSSGGTVTTIDLDQGEAEFKVAKHDDSEFQVTVKNKTISLDHSGSFRITSINSDPLEIAVFKGGVTVHDPESGDDVAVNKNETFTLDPTDPAQYALDKGTEADQLDQWSKQRDDYLSAYASANNGYPYQYGAGDLNYYGQYFDVPGYGMVWQPNNVNLGWDPFMNGYWTYSPAYGYTWVSAYPWGWLPYRYGNWVYINSRGWCWVPGGWSRWHTGPRWTNAPPGFRAPVPPADKIVISGAPGGRVVRPGTPSDSGGRVRNQGTGNTVSPTGRFGNDDRGRTNRRVFTNDDVARVPRTDVPATQTAPGTVKVDGKPEVVEQQPATGGTMRNPDAGRFQGNGQPMRNPDAGRFRGDDSAPRTSVGDHGRASYTPQPVAPAASQPVRQYTPPPQAAPQPAPVRQYTPPPAPAPVHQSAPAPPPQRSFSPPAESHASEGGHSGRPK